MLCVLHEGIRLCPHLPDLEIVLVSVLLLLFVVCYMEGSRHCPHVQLHCSVGIDRTVILWALGWRGMEVVVVCVL